MVAGSTLVPGECLLCGGRSRREILRVHRPVHECTSCGLVWSEPEAGEDLATRYGRDYFEGSVYANYFADGEAIRRNATRALRDLEAAPGKRLLDVGCAAGFFLDEARSQGWTVAGVELSEYAARYAREELRLDVYRGSVLDLPDDSGPFDAVTLWDCIEHLERPDLALRRLRGMMSPGGVLIISTGDHRSAVRRFSGRRWRLYSDETHIFFFDAQSLSRLLAREGFGLQTVSHRGKWVSVPMMVQQAPIPLPLRWRVSLQRSLSGRFLYVNLWDVMTVAAVTLPTR